MKNIILLISCLCTVVSGTLRHFDHAATDAAVVTPVVAPAPAPAATAADCRRAYTAQYAGTPRLTLAMHPMARHFLLDDAPAWCWQQLDQVLTRYRPAPHPRA